MGLCQVVVTWMVHPDLSLEEIRSVMGPTASRLASLAMIVDNGTDPLPPRLAAVGPLTPRILATSKPEVDHVLSVEFAGAPMALAGTVISVRPDSFTDRGSARMLVDGGALPALASAHDPHGVSMVGLGWMMLLAMELGELTAEEAVWAATRGSALALGDDSRGLVRAGAAADLVIVDGESAWDLIRRPGVRPWSVIVSGVSVTE
jgi:imidazolonepropionase-like amidohydrolase